MRVLKTYFGFENITRTKKILIFITLTFIGVIWVGVEHNKKLDIDDTPLKSIKEQFQKNSSQIDALETRNKELNITYIKYKKYLFSEEEKQGFVSILTEMSDVFAQQGIFNYRVSKVLDNAEYFNAIDIYLNASNPQVSKKLLEYFLGKYSDILIKEIKVIGGECVVEIYKK